MKEEMKQVLFIPTGSLSPKDKERLTKGGYIVVECNDPERIKTISDIEAVNPNILLKASLKGLAEGASISDARDKFVSALSKLIQES